MIEILRNNPVPRLVDDLHRHLAVTDPRLLPGGRAEAQRLRGFLERLDQLETARFAPDLPRDDADLLVHLAGRHGQDEVSTAALAALLPWHPSARETALAQLPRPPGPLAVPVPALDSAEAPEAEPSPVREPYVRIRGGKRRAAYGILRRMVMCDRWCFVYVQTICAHQRAKGTSISERTILDLLRDLARREDTPEADPVISIRMVQQYPKHKKNAHFRWMVARRSWLRFDGKPLYRLPDGRTRHLRQGCKEPDLPDPAAKRPDQSSAAEETFLSSIPGTWKNSGGLKFTAVKESSDYKEVRVSTPRGGVEGPGIKKISESDLDPLNRWKRDAPPIESVLWAMGLPTYEDPEGRLWTHSPWRRLDNRRADCQIHPEGERFYDYVTERGGNIVTLAQLALSDPGLRAAAALAHWRGRRLPDRVHSPKPWTKSPRRKSRCLRADFYHANIFYRGDDDDEGATDRPPETRQVRQRREAAERHPRPPGSEAQRRLAHHLCRRYFRDADRERDPWAKEVDWSFFDFCFRANLMAGKLAAVLARGIDRRDVEAVLQAGLARWSHHVSDAVLTEWNPREETPEWLAQKMRRQTPKPVVAWRAWLGRLRRDLDFLPRFRGNWTSPDRVERRRESEAMVAACAQLEAMFPDPGQEVWVTVSPDQPGWCRPRAAWVEEFRCAGVPTGPQGAWVALNPCTQAGRRQVHLTSRANLLVTAKGAGAGAQRGRPPRLPSRLARRLRYVIRPGGGTAGGEHYVCAVRHGGAGDLPAYRAGTATDQKNAGPGWSVCPDPVALVPLAGTGPADAVNAGEVPTFQQGQPSALPPPTAEPGLVQTPDPACGAAVAAPTSPPPSVIAEEDYLRMLAGWD